MRKTKEEILDYQAICSSVKKSVVLTAEEKEIMLKALSDSFNKDIEVPLGTPEQEKLDEIIDKFTGGE